MIDWIFREPRERREEVGERGVGDTYDYGILVSSDKQGGSALAALDFALVCEFLNGGVEKGGYAGSVCVAEDCGGGVAEAWVGGL